ncbi:helix-turn-helix domain-containing protein [Clostridium sp. Cult2]|uniref:helix-turn-helix domain-containing protein n=1 Tax=Clostridium sp. Cult2 TaxID=2079003 RepID=UPI001F47E79D|nr:helix-turn-helix domain-containing protein [Clostridium sp. Cult2]MCF6466383.1 sigma-70 family RNA polymerase sigma factor [Clostridium sp. Cult2]
MQIESSIDLRYNIAAMYIAILREDIATPEQAFAVVSDSSVVKATTDEDVLDMIVMKNQGLTYKQIAEIYGSTDSNIYHRIKRYKEKKTSSGSNQKRSAIK